MLCGEMPLKLFKQNKQKLLWFDIWYGAILRLDWMWKM